MPSADFEMEDLNKNMIIFNGSKQELFKVNENFKSFHRKLKSVSKVLVNRDEINLDALKNCNLLILPAPQTFFEESELKAMETYVQEGGRVLVLLIEGSPNDPCNINILLERFGIVPNLDCLIRTHYYKYFHPKECYIADPQVNSSLNKNKSDIKLIYPFGCTMSVLKPSVVCFKSGFASFPVDCPLGAVYYNEKTGGKLVAVGSGHMFSDKYLEQENNDLMREVLLKFLQSNEQVHFLATDHDDMDVTDRNIVPETAELAEKPKLCLTDVISNTSVVDYVKLFDHNVHSMNTHLLPATLKLYERLGVKHTGLKIITPKFEAPYPALQAAVFPPCFRELPPPSLELFDLDEAFSSVFSKLAQFTNKYVMSDAQNDEEKFLSNYVKRCCKIVGSDEEESALKLLYNMGTEIAEFKSIDNIK
ncbi:intraflagellar transport protein 52 homolog [Anthonomus grandis grandis]|uniref:intraflagellar transport protein 52 homolog n=1 Tax=Anthonomus grandis grandis TaxID=2921223 RepID=UPI00216611BE|nr:intraflagellar transport protein 52 homolog [Anthonomus grandis grandis]